MEPLLRFWNQPNGKLRDFQIVYSLLTVNFFLPSLIYALDPGRAIHWFERMGRLLGGGGYYFYVAELGYVWCVLAAGNVMGLAFMCLLLQTDLRKFYPVLWPLVFIKSLAALGFLAVWASCRYPAFLAVSLWDGLTVFLMVHFGLRAYRTLAPVA